MKKPSTATKSKTDWNRLHSMRDDEIDLSDIPKIDSAMFKKMVIRMPKPKELVSIRIDPDVLTWFRQRGRRYQTRMNAVLRSYVEAQEDHGRAQQSHAGDSAPARRRRRVA